MLDVVWWLVVLSAKLFGLLLACYFIYYRVLLYGYLCWFYGRQKGVCVLGHGHLPFVGNLPQAL